MFLYNDGLIQAKIIKSTTLNALMEEGRLCSTKNHLLPRKYHYGIPWYVVGSLATYLDLMNLMTALILQITLDENFFQVNWAKTSHILYIRNRRHRKISVSSILIHEKSWQSSTRLTWSWSFQDSQNPQNPQDTTVSFRGFTK